MSSTDSPTIAVTGAAGYIGSRVLERLQAEHPDWSITAIDNFYRGTVREIGDIIVDHVDIRDRDRLWDALDGADVVMHLAAISGVDDCEEHQDLAYEVNVTATEHVVRFCRAQNTALIFPASMAIIGDPEEFPVTVNHPRDPLNWYGRTKLLGEQIIETLSEDAFPAHLFLKSNLYGKHQINGKVVSKGTVINFFVSRALEDEPLTVYEPGTQSRNFIHVKDVARAYVQSSEALLEQLADDETGVQKYEIASDEDPSIHSIAKLVQEISRKEANLDPEVTLIENPRSGESLVDEFRIDTSKAQEDLGWKAQHTVEDSIRKIVRQHDDR